MKAAAVVLLHLAACPARAEVSLPAGAGTTQAQYARLKEELKAGEERLSAARAELAKLRHRWMVVKGRTPTEKEIKEFEEKVAKGKADPLENPYYNASPLSNPAPARAAYYRKLEQVRLDEETVRQLKERIAELELQGAR